MNGANQIQQTAIISLFSPIIDIIVDKVSERVLAANENKEPKYYSRRETAKLLRMTLPTLGRLTRDGLIKAKKVGSRILYDAADIDAAVKENIVFKYRKA